MRTTKEKGRRNMEEGTMNGVEATRNKEMQAMTKRKKRGEKVEREILLKERLRNTRNIQEGTNPRGMTLVVKPNIQRMEVSIVEKVHPTQAVIEIEEMDILKENEV